MRLRTPALLLVLAVVVLTGAACGTSEGSQPFGGAVLPGDGTTIDDTSTVPTTNHDGTDGAADEGVEVSGAGYHGWIIDPDAVDYEVLGRGVPLVWADPADVARAEAIVAEDLPRRRDGEGNARRGEDLADVADRLGTYERQYVAGDDDGRLLVYVNALCDADIGSGALERSMITVSDGGSCFWQAEVDLESGTVTTLSINGQA